MIAIDAEKCSKCNLCVAVCTKNVISEGPMIDAERNQYCIKCGHCFAVCPTQAISILNDDGSNYADNGVVEVQSDLIDSDTLMTLMKCRRSVRSYKSEAVSREDMSRILEAAALAPSAKNNCNLSAFVFSDADLIKKIARQVPAHYKKLLKLFKLPGFPLIWKKLGYPADKLEAYRKDFIRLTTAGDGEDPILHHAPTLLVFASEQGDAMTIADGWIAAQNSIMLAQTLGVGSCYNGYLTIAANKDKKLKAMMNVPANMTIISAMTLGYPTIKFQRSALRKPMQTVWQ